MTKRWNWWLLGILALASILRLWMLGDLPASLNRDEAALAYNAVLLNATGRDEWGVSHPLSLQSFGDYKLIGYVWHLQPLLLIAGQSEWVVRLPAALAGIGLVLLTWLVVSQWKWSSTTKYLATFWVAVMPVFLFYSRMAWEANVALSWLVLSWLAILRAGKTRQWWLDCVAIGAALIALLTYNTPLFILPAIILLVPFLRNWRQPKDWAFLVIGLSGVLVWGGWQLMSVAGQKSGITIFADQTVWAHFVEYRQHLPANLVPVLGKLPIYWLGLMGLAFIKSVGPVFLVVSGGSHPWHQVPGFGHLLLVVYLLGWWGWLVQIKDWWRWWQKKRVQSLPEGWWLGVLLVVSLVPAVITVDAPHATRSLFMMWLWVLAAGFGLESWLRWVKQDQTLNRIILGACLGLTVLGAGQYLFHYFGPYRTQSAVILQAGLAEALSQTADDQAVAVVDGGGYTYILVAWYAHLSPEVFFQTVVKQLPDRIGLRYGQQVGKYHFIAQPTDRSLGETALIEWKNDQWQVIR